MGSVWDDVENCRRCGKECVPEDDGMCRGCSPAARERDNRFEKERSQELRKVEQFIKDNKFKWVSVQ